MPVFASQKEEDFYWMGQALAAAREAAFLAPPNPAVGCVIVKNHEEISRGFTQRPGGHHAEIEALNAAAAAGRSVKGATVYVTLEPCSCYGHTPPCASRLVWEGVGRVVAALEDPNPEVSGRGFAMLRAAGIKVTEGVRSEEALVGLRGFFKRMRTGLPWVRMKVAQSLDGFTALPNGVSQWITSAKARDDGRRLRAYSQAVVTGVGTVLADDPQMNVRVATLPDPPKYVFDAQCRTPAAARILLGAPCTVFTAESAPLDNRTAVQRTGAKVQFLPEVAPGKLDIEAAVESFGRAGVNLVHLEAGATLNSAFLAAGLVDEIVCYVAPVMLGAGRPAADLPERTTLAGLERWSVHSTEKIGQDVKIVLYRQPLEEFFE